MKYNFDEIIDRRHEKYSYSMKWGQGPFVADMVGVQEVKEYSIPLFTADMDFRCAQPILDALEGVVKHGIFGYSRQEFAKGYYDAIIHWFEKRRNWKIKEDEIVYVNGTVEAIKQIIIAFTNPGDGVIIQRPVYGPFSGVINQTKRNIVNNALVEKANGYYEMNFEDLERKAADENNKILLLCNPHNPVGRIWNKEELQKVSDICERNNVLIVVDEIHGDLIRKSEEFHPMATLVHNSKLITCTAVNKTFNLAGLHATNLVISDKNIREHLKESMGFIGPSPFTLAATIAAYTEGEEWLEQLLDYLDDNIDFVINYLKEYMPKAKCRRPEGTYILWIDLREYNLSAKEIHRRIYEEAGVLLEGGELFDPEHGAGFERICVPSPRPLLEEALKRISAVFEK